MKNRVMNRLRAAARIAAAAALGTVVLAGASLAALAAVPVGTTGQAPSPERAADLRHLLVQDCGSCHGLRRNGGLGPPLVPAALAGKPPAFLAYTILNGRPGTAMPPWEVFMSEAEARWLADELKRPLTGQLDGQPAGGRP